MTDAQTLLSIAAVIALASLLQQAAGFGFALAATPLLAVVIDPHSAVVLGLLMGFLGIAWQAFEGRRACRWPIVGRVLVGSSVGLIPGLLVFRAVEGWALQVLVGLAVLTVVGPMASGLKLQHASHRIDYGAGLLSGMLTTSVGTAGPPVVFTLAGQGLSPDAFRATLTAVFVALDAFGIIVFCADGAVTAPMLLSLVLTLPALAVGGAVGARLRRHLPADRFRRLTLVLMTASGLAALMSGLLGAIGQHQPR